jgi:hypothetical protein
MTLSTYGIYWTFTDALGGQARATFDFHTITVSHEGFEDKE